MFLDEQDAADLTRDSLDVFDDSIGHVESVADQVVDRDVGGGVLEQLVREGETQALRERLERERAEVGVRRERGERARCDFLLRSRDLERLPLPLLPPTPLPPPPPLPPTP